MQLPYLLPPVLIELAEVDGKFTVPEQIQIMRTGTFHDPRYKKFTLDKAVLASIKKNFDARVRGVDIAIDLNHDPDHLAAAWFKELDLRNDGEEIWAKVDWTPRGEKVLSQKELRYFSPEFHPDYEDNESLQKFGPTLLGGGLTNRPVIKGMQPAIQLAEFKKGEDPMTPEQIAEYEEMKQACEAAGMTVAEMVQKMSQLEKQNTDLQGAVQANEATLKLSEKKSAFDKMLTAGKACEAQREAFMSDDMVKFAELQKPLNLSEAGHGSATHEGAAEGLDPKSKTPAQDRVLALAEEKRQKNKDLDAGDAISLVLSEHSDLRAQYEREVSV